MNKHIIISLAIIAAVAAITIGGTKAYFSSTATSNGNTFTSGTMHLRLSNRATGGYGDGVVKTWNIGNMVPGGTPYVSTLYMKNIGTIGADYLKFVTRNTNVTPGGMDRQVRITELKYAGKNLLTGGAGADLSNYVAPTYCDVTVDPSGTYKTIHEGIAVANTGDVVCVKPGNYHFGWKTTAFPITVGKSITLVSLEGPDTTIITAQTGKNAIDITNNDVTVKGFTITGGVVGIDTGGKAGIVVRDNIIKNYNGQGAEGILVNSGNVNVVNNKIEASGTPNPTYSIDSIYIKGGATVTVTHNDLGNNQYGPNAYNPSTQNWSTAAGLSLHDGCNVTATYNAIHNNDFGVHVKNANAIIVANYNDISGNSRDFFFEAPGNGCPSTPFNFENNWWGDYSPADHVTGNVAGCSNGMSDVIDYTPYAGGAFIGYINGKDYNGNHFADLNDFYGVTGSSYDNNPVVVENPDLKANGVNWHTLVMGVQLDGPTTGNHFQGGNVLTNMTVTMGQGPAK